jgi:alkane 1-monooxygenase
MSRAMSIVSFMSRRRSALVSPSVPAESNAISSQVNSGTVPEPDPSPDDAETLSAVFAALQGVPEAAVLAPVTEAAMPAVAADDIPDAPVAEAEMPEPSAPELSAVEMPDTPTAAPDAIVPEDTPPALPTTDRIDDLVNVAMPVPSEDDPLADAIAATLSASVPDEAQPKRHSRVPLRLRLRQIAASVQRLRVRLARPDPFLAATLAPVPLIAAALIFGGWVALVAFAAITVLTFALDELGDKARIATPAKGGEFPVTRNLSIILAAAHGLLLALGLFALSGGASLGFVGWWLAFLSLGLWLGQVSNSNAHELIHSGDPRLRATGAAIFCSLLFGHHVSAHRLVHHRFVATSDDPNSADAGESFWAFLPRAWIGSFIAGYEMERALMRPRFGRKARRLHPYAQQIGTSALMLVLIGLTLGVPGICVWLMLCAHAQLQLLLSDYVQHYGLVRAKMPGGRTEPVGPRHAWNAPHAFSGLAMLNAPRHSDHHQRPGRPYGQLALDPGVPMLPHSLPVMATAALVPTVWRRMMDPRVAVETRRRLAASGGAAEFTHGLVQARSRPRSA